MSEMSESEAAAVLTAMRHRTEAQLRLWERLAQTQPLPAHYREAQDVMRREVPALTMAIQSLRAAPSPDSAKEGAE